MNKFIEETKKSADDLIKKAFNEGIKYAIKNEFLDCFRYCVARRNFGAKDDDDQNFGYDASGWTGTYAEAMATPYFDILNKEFLEYYDLLTSSSWEGHSNQDYQGRRWNQRAVFRGKLVFYHSHYFDNELIKDNDIDPSEYKDCWFALNWLADEVDENTAYAIAIPIFPSNRNLYTGSGWDTFRYVHNIGKPLIVKVPKKENLPFHVMIEKK